MEFFVKVPLEMSIIGIQRYINLKDLTKWCASISKATMREGHESEVECLWGHLHIHRELIKFGVRFSLPDEPHALQWTITTVDDKEVMLHCTINCQQCDPEFIGSLETFIADWQKGIETWPQRRDQLSNKSCINCGETFGGFG